MEVLLCKTLKHPETYGYERDRSLRCEIRKPEKERNSNIIETRKK